MKLVCSTAGFIMILFHRMYIHSHLSSAIFNLQNMSFPDQQVVHIYTMLNSKNELVNNCLRYALKDIT